MRDPGFLLTCPDCGRKLAFLDTYRETHVYHCNRHGLMVLSRDGRVRPETPAETERRVSFDRNWSKA